MINQLKHISQLPFSKPVPRLIVGHASAVVFHRQTLTLAADSAPLQALLDAYFTKLVDGTGTKFGIANHAVACLARLEHLHAELKHLTLKLAYTHPPTPSHPKPLA